MLPIDKTILILLLDFEGHQLKGLNVEGVADLSRPRLDIYQVTWKLEPWWGLKPLQRQREDKKNRREDYIFLKRLQRICYPQILMKLTFKFWHIFLLTRISPYKCHCKNNHKLPWSLLNYNIFLSLTEAIHNVQQDYRFKNVSFMIFATAKRKTLHLNQQDFSNTKLSFGETGWIYSTVAATYYQSL